MAPRDEEEIDAISDALVELSNANTGAAPHGVLHLLACAEGAPDRPFRTWLLSIASHHCIDELRRRGREQKIFDPGEIEVVSDN